MKWRVETPEPIRPEELEAVPLDMRAKFDHVIRPIEEFGLPEPSM